MPQVEWRTVKKSFKPKEITAGKVAETNLMSFWDRIGAEKSDNPKSLLELEARTILENRNRSEQELETNAKPSIKEVDLTVESPSESPEVSVIKKEKTNHKSRKDNPRQGELSTENSLDNLTKLFDRSQLRQAVLKKKTVG